MKIMRKLEEIRLPKLESNGPWIFFVIDEYQKFQILFLMDFQSAELEKVNLATRNLHESSKTFACLKVISSTNWLT